MLHTFETKDRNELDEFMNLAKPDIYHFYERPDPVTLDTIYGVKWCEIRRDRGMTANQILRAFDEMRTAKKISRDDILDAVGISHSTLYAYLNGNTGQLDRIIKMLDMVGLELVVRQKGETK